jgi:hypothetical protein
VGPSAPEWSPLEALLLQATDELHSERQISGATWDALAANLNEMQLIELCFLVGQYEMLAMFLRTVGVQLEPGKDPLPSRDPI